MNRVVENSFQPVGRLLDRGGKPWWYLAAIWMSAPAAFVLWASALGIYSDVGWRESAEHIYQRSLVTLAVFAMGTLVLLRGARWSWRAFMLFLGIGIIAALLALGYEHYTLGCCPYIDVWDRGYPYGFVRHRKTESTDVRWIEPVGALVNVLVYATVAMLLATVRRTWRDRWRLAP
ncbi:hypothetical protein C5E43_14885 [Nocardia cyriacigeorgica]|jgi:amino acid transporter|nr:hypothetical protein C5E43_14885 [Nocardia cyriacigeorgica]